MNKKKFFGYGTRNSFFAAVILSLAFALFLTGCPTDADTTPAHVHDYEWTVTRAATCIATGAESGVCKLDPSHTTTRDIPIDLVDGHAWGEWTGTVTCTEGGTGARVCSRSAAHTETNDNLPALGHAYNDEDWEETEAPTCSEAGAEEANCVRYAECGYTGTREIPIDLVNGHNWQPSPTATAPTCTVDGNGDQICSINQEHTTTGVIPKLGHAYNDEDWEEIKAPTCSQKGLEEAECVRYAECGYTRTREIAIDPDAHDYQMVSTATETEDGEEGMVCTHNASHKQGTPIIAYATGTEGLAYTATPNSANPTAYSVARGTASGDIAIPAFHRLDPDSPYLPVQIPGNNNYTTFGGTSSTITSITFTEGSQLATIGPNAFLNCTSLTSITIPASVTSIGENAFSGCTGLTSITIPEGVTSVHYYAFTGCTNLTDIIIDTDKVTGMYNTYNWGTWFPAADLSVTFNKNIGASALENCTRLASVTLSEGVTAVGNNAFAGCTNLADIIIDTELTPMPANGWSSIFPVGNFSVTLKKSVPYRAFGYGALNASLKSVTIDAGITSIGEMAFYYCTGLTSITIPESVTSIGEQAFFQCRSLTSIIIPTGVTSISDETFSQCHNLTNITIPAGVTSIGYGAFYNSGSLASVIIPASVTSIGASAFSSCSSLASIIIPASVTSIGDSAFYSCTSLTSVTFEGTIPSSSFSNASSYNAVFFGDLRAKFYATASTSGTPGTYTTATPANSSSVWTKQP